MGWCYTFYNDDTGMELPDSSAKFVWVDKCGDDIDDLPSCALEWAKNDNGKFYIKNWTIDKNSELWYDYYHMTYNLAKFISYDDAVRIEKRNAYTSDIGNFLTSRMKEYNCNGLIMEWS